MSTYGLTQQEAALDAGWSDREARLRLRALRAEIRAQWLATIEPEEGVGVGRWSMGTVQAKKGRALEAALAAVELPVDSEGDVDEAAQAQLELARGAILVLAEGFAGELHITANGYAARGGKRAAEQPTSFVTLGITVVDPATGAPRPWVAAAAAEAEIGPTMAAVVDPEPERES